MGLFYNTRPEAILHTGKSLEYLLFFLIASNGLEFRYGSIHISSPKVFLIANHQKLPFKKLKKMLKCLSTVKVSHLPDQFVISQIWK